ncbi:hypothetical protein CFP56_013267 [Quercus suber]|uniref:Uncharacterized protein n=1 Tax=Quercus suber TaxID=58331 RepID=A0AAW0KWK0_QUESU
MAPFLQHPKTQSTKMASSGSPRISTGFLPQATSSMKAPKANTSVQYESRLPQIQIIDSNKDVSGSH